MFVGGVKGKKLLLFMAFYRDNIHDVFITAGRNAAMKYAVLKVLYVVAHFFS